MGGAATADRFQPRALGLDRIGVAEAIDDHIGAVVGKGLRDAEPDARGRSGDEGGLSFKAHGGVLSVMNGSVRSEEHTSELQSLMRISYAVFCLKKKKKNKTK